MADERGNTPLHIAFMRDDLGTIGDITETARRLIDAKADLDVLNEDHLSPVDLGLDSNSQEMKKFLKTLVGKSKVLAQWRTRM
jgi:ankyrin repeat protein